ncbi:MAG: hypothetical protein JWP91_2636 [Fibrobacteres bacterium]|nr:hypothetical protein [Fibrobacterota bacterium]
MLIFLGIPETRQEARMSRSKSLPRSFLRILSAACILAFGAVAAPVSAQTLVTTNNFNLTLPPGWSKFSAGQTDTASVIIMNIPNEANGILMGVPHQGALTSAEITAALNNLAASDSLIILDQGNKTLGGKAFSFIEFKNANPADEQEASDRFRIYYLTQGTFLFEAIVVYPVDKSGPVAAGIEAALATLNLTASAHLRAVADFSRPGFRPADHDVMGRSNAVQARRTILFRVPGF